MLCCSKSGGGKTLGVVNTGFRRSVRIPVSLSTASVRSRSLAFRSFQHFPPREFIGIIELCRRPKQALPVLYRQLIQKTPVRRELFEQFGRRAQALQQCKLDSEVCIHRGPAGMSTIIAALAKPLGRIELWKLHGTHRG